MKLVLTESDVEEAVRQYAQSLGHSVSNLTLQFSRKQGERVWAEVEARANPLVGMPDPNPIFQEVHPSWDNESNELDNSNGDETVIGGRTARKRAKA